MLTLFEIEYAVFSCKLDFTSRTEEDLSLEPSVCAQICYLCRWFSHIYRHVREHMTFTIFSTPRDLSIYMILSKVSLCYRYC